MTDPTRTQRLNCSTMLARHGVRATFFVIDKHLTAKLHPSCGEPSKGTLSRFTGTRVS